MISHADDVLKSDNGHCSNCLGRDKAALLKLVLEEMPKKLQDNLPLEKRDIYARAFNDCLDSVTEKLREAFK